MDNVKIGIVGLGRLGSKHAENLAHKIKGCTLLAACSIDEAELSQAEQEFGVKYVYNDYEAMLENSELDGIFIASSSTLHKEQIIKALEAGFHVFCEKPLALNLDDCYEVEKVAKKYPDRIVSIGFVRRYDPSYNSAKARIDQQIMGTPFQVRSQTVDMDKTAKFQTKFVKTSGGIFLDANIHDIDLARWYLNSEAKSVYTLGGCYRHKEFEEYNDADNVTTLVEFENNTMATLSVSRTAFHGHATKTEILCTEGILEVGFSPIKNHVQIDDEHGIRRECVETFFDRFEEAFLIEDKSFIESIMKGTKPKVAISDAIRATEVAVAMGESYQSRKVVKL